MPSPDPRTGRAPVHDDALHRATTGDALYVLAAGDIGGSRHEPEPDPAAEGTPGLDLELLLREVGRRLRTAALDGVPVRPETDRVRRVSRTASTTPKPALTPGELAVLDLADGMYTLRDMAFALERGVFGVVLDALHLVSEGVLQVERATTSWFEPPVPRPRARPSSAGVPAPRNPIRPTAPRAAQPAPTPPEDEPDGDSTPTMYLRVVPPAEEAPSTVGTEPEPADDPRHESATEPDRDGIDGLLGGLFGRRRRTDGDGERRPSLFTRRRGRDAGTTAPAPGISTTGAAGDPTPADDRSDPEVPSPIDAAPAIAQLARRVPGATSHAWPSTPRPAGPDLRGTGFPDGRAGR
ncbi:MAG: hypothetical protein ABS81_17185 [Pseudonocardia sp. SCN 72-86]|nr:MAG: hypothetical protein ABS81_17185 [Pseudonocardia sp. SCN 72-86]